MGPDSGLSSRRCGGAGWGQVVFWLEVTMQRRHVRMCVPVLLALAGLFWGTACGDDDGVGPAPVGADMDEYMSGMPNWDAFSPMETETNEASGAESDPFEDVVDGVRYRCTTTPYTITRNPDKIVTLDPDANVLWPGALIQGHGYAKGPGSLLEVPIRARAPLEVSLDLLSGESSVIVEHPTLGTVTEAVGGLVERAQRMDHVAGSSISYAMEETHSVDQSFLGLGLSIRTVPVTVKAKLNISQTAASHTLSAYFVQRMFTVSIGLPERPGDVFSDELTAERLQDHVDRGVIGPDNPPVYVANIVFGRILMMSITSDSTYDRLVAAVNASFKAGAVSGGAGVTDTNLRVLSNSRINVVTVGGDGNNAVSLLQSGQLRDYFKADAPLTSARPISYTLRNLKDNSIATVSETSQYNITTCEPVNVRGTLRVDVTPNDAKVRVLGAGNFDSGELLGDQVLGELQAGGYTVYAYRGIDGGGVDTAWTIDTAYTEVWGGDTTDVVVGIIEKTKAGDIYRVVLHNYVIESGACAYAATEGNLEIYYNFKMLDDQSNWVEEKGDYSYGTGYHTRSLNDFTVQRAVYLAGAKRTIEIKGDIMEEDGGFLGDDDRIARFDIVETYPAIATGERQKRVTSGSCRAVLNFTVTKLGPAPAPPPE